MSSKVSGKITKEELDNLIRTAQKGCKDSMWKVVEFHQHIIRDVEYRWNIIGGDPSTKYHGALMGLAAAVIGYDFSTEFETYAKMCAYRKAQEEITKDKMVKIPRNRFFEMLRNNEIPSSMAMPYDEDEYYIDGKHCRRLQYEHTTEDHSLREDKKIIKKAISRLPIREKEAIEMEHGFSDETKEEICKRFDCSRQRVEQIVKSGHNRLQKILLTKGITCIA